MPMTDLRALYIYAIPITFSSSNHVAVFIANGHVGVFHSKL